VTVQFSVEQIESAKVHRSKGMGWAKLGRMFSCHEDTVRRALDPSWKRRRKDLVDPERYQLWQATHSISGPPKEVLERREHRLMLRHNTLTGLLMNDPLPGESALEKRI
jgi:hypothetical protein